MKQRLTAIDIRALVMTLKRKVMSLRVANIYDISNKSYLFKLAAKGNKEFLLVEAGIRMHTTDFVRNKNSIPSGFTMKLRKHLRTKRIEDIRQVGIDRVVDITLGQGEKAYHILIEFYASGNLILTDDKYNIISLLRTHRYDEDTRCAVGEPYPFTHAANLSLDSIVSDKKGIEEMLKEVEEKKEEESQSGKKQKKKSKKRRDEGGVKDTLIKMVPYMTPLMAEHCLIEVGLDQSEDFDIENQEMVDKIIKAALLCKDMVHNLENMEYIPGYIVYDEVPESEENNQNDLLAKEKKKQQEKQKSKEPEKSEQREAIEKELEIKPMEDIKEEVEEAKKKKEDEGESDEEEAGVDPEQLFKGKRVKEFICFQLHQMKQQHSLEFDWFDVCVDLYFTQIDKQKEESKLQQKEAEIYKKMNRIKDDQLKRIEGLQKEQDNSLAKAKLLQKYIAEVQAILEILSALLQSGLQWKEIWRMIKEEKRAGNPLAAFIHGLELEKEKVILMFNTAEMEQKEEVDEFFADLDEDIIVRVDLELALSAQANIKKYFEIKKKTQDKEIRTKDKANEAIKHAEDQARRALLKTRNEQKLKTTRKPYWFEKYDWFISSENYLIISGKNAQQNEEIVKTYLLKTDVYVHSEMAGSASCIIKNPSKKEVSPLTLNEVGQWAICHSKAWDLKIVTNAFWVWGDQVSKTPQSGEYLVQGSFMIRGKKNYVNPTRLELGLTVMFNLDDDSVANHLNERRNRTEGVDVNDLITHDNPKTKESRALNEEHAQVKTNNVDEEESQDQNDIQEEADEQVQKEDEIQENAQEQPIAQDTQATTETEPETQSTQNVKDEAKEDDKEEAKGEEEEDQEEAEGEDNEEEKIEQPSKPQKDENKESKNQNKPKEKDTKVDVQNLPRGKKQKLKKMKKKYADQDEEDKKLIMEFIGAKEMQKGSKKQKNKQEAEPYYPKGKGDQQKVKNQQNQKQKQNQNQNKQKQAQQQKTQNKGKDPQFAKKQSGATEDEQKEIEELMKQEGVKMLQENVDVSVLDKLTGNPKPNDTLLYAVAM